MSGHFDNNNDIERILAGRQSSDFLFSNEVLSDYTGYFDEDVSPDVLDPSATDYMPSELIFGMERNAV